MPVIPDEPFKDHKPGDKATKDIKTLVELLDGLQWHILSTLPASRERQEALTNLQQSGMWLKLAATFADPDSVTIDHFGMVMLPELHGEGAAMLGRIDRIVADTEPPRPLDVFSLNKTHS